MDNALDANNNYTCNTARKVWFLYTRRIQKLSLQNHVKSTLSALETLVDSIGTNHPYNAMTQLMEEVMIDYEINMQFDKVQLWHKKRE